MYYQATPLSENVMLSQAPSIFATAPHPEVSERYGFVPTVEVLRNLEREGWYPVQATQTPVRDAGRFGYARHKVRLRRLHDHLEMGECVPELVLTNSHDRSSAYRLDIGLFRLLCSNGLIVSLGHLGGGIRVRHGRNIVKEVIEGSFQLVEELPGVVARVGQFRDMPLTTEEQEAFAEAALTVRYGEDWRAQSPVGPGQLLDARRREDAGDDLWGVYNRVQENFMKGGLDGRSARTGRRVRTRGIRGIQEDLRLNRALWVLAERIAELKEAT